MSLSCGSIGAGIEGGRHQPGRLDAADWLSLAAAPTFTVMALLAGVFGSSSPDALCAATHDASALSGMVPMYLLMSALHLAPWLKLILSCRHYGGDRCKRL